MNRNHIQVILVSLVCILVSLAQAADFAGGTGEPNDPYLIATAEQLLAVDFNEPGTYFRLCNDIDMEGRGRRWHDSFRGHLDGAGFEVQNAVCPRQSFFGIIESEASISNLVLTNVGVVTATWPDYPGDQYGTAGAFTMENYGTITNCGVTGIVSTWRVGLVGGIVGLNDGTIVNCYFDGWVLAPWEDVFGGDASASVCVGGLVGVNAYDGLIANSLAGGTVLGNRGVGGLVGSNWGTIRNCYFRGSVLGQVGAGGLVSENTGHLQTCYAISEVTGEMKGGLVGLAGGAFRGSASNCLWDLFNTNCERSAAGVLVLGLSADTLALNGWAGDPNWILPVGDYPRLVWEGIPGTAVPPPDEVTFSGGSGTENDPYVITTWWDWRVLSRASIYWDKHFVLAHDLDAGGDTVGIGPGSSFSGTFDGNGHVIRKLRIGWPSSGTPVWNGGLFGYVTGEVRNLILEDCEIIGGVNSQRVGVLAGTNAGVVTNCSVAGSIIVGEYSQFIGELIGVNFGEVNDCDAVVTVEAGEGSTEIGGLIGAEDPPFPR